MTGEQKVKVNQIWHYGDYSLVKELFLMYDSGKYYLYEIAEWFGISQTCVRRTLKERKNYEKIFSQSLS